MPNNIDEVLKLDLLFESSNLDSVTDFQKVLLRSLNNIEQILIDSPTQPSRQKLNAIRNQVLAIIRDDYPQLFDLIQRDKAEWSALMYEANTVALQQVVGSSVVLSFDRLPESAIKKILDPKLLVQGQTLKDSIQILAGNNANRVVGFLAEGLATGQPTADIVRNIRNVYSDISRNKLDTLARTAIGSAMSEANQVATDNFGSVINRAFYNATLDSRTTPYCSSMDGTIWRRKPDESYQDFKTRVLTPSAKSFGKSPNPPATTHFNCRSILSWTTSEQLNEFLNEDSRAATFTDDRTVNHRDGTKSTKRKIVDVEREKGKVKFKDWFNRQDDAFKLKYLGESRFKLHKDGVPLKDFLDPKNNRFLTLDQIKKK